jgi:tripartite-type tricarboxylate transporter receptor subunit TctC
MGHHSGIGIRTDHHRPQEIVLKLNAEINKALEADDVRARLTANGIDIQGGTPERFAAYIKAEVAKWGKVIREAGIQPE